KRWFATTRSPISRARHGASCTDRTSPPTSSGCWPRPPPSSWSPPRSRCACTTRNVRLTSDALFPRPDEVNGAGGEREREPACLEPFLEGEVDRLLYVHVVVVVGIEDPVDDLELQARVPEALEVRALEGDAR